MLLIVSPAKTLDFDSPVPELTVTRPAFTKDAAALIDGLRALPVDKIAETQRFFGPVVGGALLDGHSGQAPTGYYLLMAAVVLITAPLALFTNDTVIGPPL